MAHQPFRDRSVLSKIGYILAGSLWLVGLFCTLCWLPVIQYIRKRTQKTPVERKRQTSRVPPLPQFPTPRQRALTLPLDAPSATQYTLDQSKSIFFSKLPLELRRKVYSYALGRKIVHLTWDRKYMHGIRCSEETRCSHRTFEAQPDCDMGISTSLLRSCRQIYSEAIETLYSDNDFVVVPVPFPAPTALLYLPHFILSQRLRQIRYLQVSWRVTLWEITVIHESIYDGWLYPWSIIEQMRGLKELYIQFWVQDRVTREAWLQKERELLEVVTKITSPSKFVAVMPTVESSTSIDTGESRCVFRLPQT